MPLPPFELVYREHRDELFSFLCKQLPEADASDAFQETCLRALRTYPGLEHGGELRAWLYTIARSVMIDRSRRTNSRPREVPADTATAGELAAQPAAERDLSDPAELVAVAAGLTDLTDRLPPTERAAVTLRYGFDMDYDQIGAALDANATAARQAASSGVRRLRRQLSAPASGEKTERGKDDSGSR